MIINFCTVCKNIATLVLKRKILLNVIKIINYSHGRIDVFFKGELGYCSKNRFESHAESLV